jgi:hypothetical protein
VAAPAECSRGFVAGCFAAAPQGVLAALKGCTTFGFACLALLASTLAAAAPIDLRLIQAVKRRDVDAVRALLKQRVDVNAVQGDGATALHWAAHRDDLAVADLLIRAGARAGVANDVGATPLHLACTNRSAPMVDRLLSAGADANAALMNGETVLMTCARAGDAGAVKALLARGADVNAREREHRQTALMWAAANAIRRWSAADRGPRRHSRPLPDSSADRRRRADRARGARY